MKQLIIVATALVLTAGSAYAKTLMLEGLLDSSIAMRQQMEFSVDSGTVKSFSFRFALPADFKSKSVSQTVDGLNLAMNPRPDSSTVEQDRFGNRFQKVSWVNTGNDIRINLSYIANVRSELSAMESRTPFPIGKVSGSDAVYLKSTEMVQSDSADIADLARKLTAGARNEYEAVSAITNHVTDAIKYTFNPPKYDALYTLETKSGNCQNFAHLNIALLRSVGIPARIVGGITLKDSWKVPIDSRNSIVQSMGQGGHAWMEIYFPDLGWLPYDPQQSRQFTSSRHIKQTHGLDSRDINDTWSGTPYLPRYSELIEGAFKSDDIKLAVKSTGKEPRSYIISNLVAGRSVAPVTEAPDGPNVSANVKPTTKQPVKPALKPPVKPVEPTVKPTDKSPEPSSGAGYDDAKSVDTEGYDDGDIKIKTGKTTKPPVKRPSKPAVAVVKKEIKHKKPAAGSAMLFGNMEFPNLVNGYSVQGNVGTRIFDKETSEYVTSQYIFAQAFYLKDGMALDKVSLAMRKFGGDGNVYVDLVRDADGRPNILDGIRSNLVSLEKITRKPGYYWVDFSFSHDAQSRLKPGKYWIVFRASGEAIMNWFYIPGKPYSEGDDTRSTAKGFKWEDILNYDFVFKVAGKAL
ncbi:MAG: transglutaminase domain-containing protein [Desulfuromonadaceae bacterium]|nr:transglutaminase domain-containing protein [Desulfuromonadaceae bacterium]